MGVWLVRDIVALRDGYACEADLPVPSFLRVLLSFKGQSGTVAWGVGPSV